MYLVHLIHNWPVLLCLCLITLRTGSPNENACVFLGFLYTLRCINYTDHTQGPADMLFNPS